MQFLVPHPVCGNVSKVHVDLILINMHPAAMNYNCKSSHAQALTQEGEARYSVMFPKYKKGSHIVRRIEVDSTYGKYILYTCTFTLHTRLCT